MNPYIERIREIEDELKNQRMFLEQLSEGSPDLFLKASEVLKSTRRPVFDIMGSKHDFQTFLAAQVNTYFHSFFSDDRIQVNVLRKNYFPSLFAVYFNNEEVIQFDIFEKYYGSLRISDKQEIEKKFKNEAQFMAQNREKLEQEKDDLLEAKHHFFKWYTKQYKKLKRNKVKTLLSDVVPALFKRRKIAEGIDKKIAALTDRINELRENEQNLIERRENALKSNEQKQEAFRIIEPLFIQSGYRLETKREKLYR